ncbi:Protein PARM-1 [Heterocephalus glaber]|uniref:Protein PARM-1 n=1 Tax=Heterocephalus glaber TaxID=10181 RepID=G5B1B1_HETGA|nr:Protein PARM-1 [Heterocephalus glaber]
MPYRGPESRGRHRITLLQTGGHLIPHYKDAEDTRLPDQGKRGEVNLIASRHISKSGPPVPVARPQDAALANSSPPQAWAGLQPTLSSLPPSLPQDPRPPGPPVTAGPQSPVMHTAPSPSSPRSPRGSEHPETGLRAQSGPTLPVSLPAKATSLAALGTSSASSPAVPTMSLASSTQDALGLPVTTAATLTLLPKNTSSEPTQEAIVSPDPSQQHTDPDTSLPGFSSTAAPSAPAPSNHSSQVPSTQPPRAPTAPAEEPSFGHTATTHATVEPGPKENTAQDAQPGKAICGPETTTPFLIMQEVGHALSSASHATKICRQQHIDLGFLPVLTTSEGSEVNDFFLFQEEKGQAGVGTVPHESLTLSSTGSVAAITVTVIAMVVLVFGVAAYLKIRHSSYGRLLDDHDYGSWGNYNNPLYDDS